MTGPADDRTPVITRDLTKIFRGHLGIGKRVAVDGLDLRAEAGSILGLLGPNGAGKTTTMKMLLGLLRPDRGSARLFGLPPADPAARSRLGYLPENPYFYSYLTAREFLDFYARLQGIAGRERDRCVKRAIARVGLVGRERVPLRKFSKGMVQRVGLAQAIQHEPELVILDEPMSGLDPAGRREVRDLVLELKDTGATVFFSSHILQDAEMICDHVAILCEGRLRAAGAVQNMLSERVHWFEVTVRGDVPTGKGITMVSSRAGETMVRVADVDTLTSMLRDLSDATRVVAVWPRRETLEDRFLSEVGAANPPDGSSAADSRAGVSSSSTPTDPSAEIPRKEQGVPR